MIRKLSLLAVSIVAVAVYGCTSGGSGGGSKSFVVTKLGGALAIFTGPGVGTSVDGYFYTAITPEVALTEEIGDGVCAITNTSGTTTSTYTPGDAGSSLTFSQGGTTFVASRSSGGGFIEYQYLTTSALSPSQTGTTWTVAAAGGPFVPAGTVANIRIPRQLVITPPPLVPGQTAGFTWNPTGADTLEIGVFKYRNALGRAYCFPPDTGSFTIPGNITSLVGSSGYFTVLNADVDKVTIGGRDVVLRGLTFP